MKRVQNTCMGTVQYIGSYGEYRFWWGPRGHWGNDEVLLIKQKSHRGGWIQWALSSYRPQNGRPSGRFIYSHNVTIYEAYKTARDLFVELELDVLSEVYTTTYP